MAQTCCSIWAFSAQHHCRSIRLNWSMCTQLCWLVCVAREIADDLTGSWTGMLQGSPHFLGIHYAFCPRDRMHDLVAFHACEPNSRPPGMYDHRRIQLHRRGKWTRECNSITEMQACRPLGATNHLSAHVLHLYAASLFSLSHRTARGRERREGSRDKPSCSKSSRRTFVCMVSSTR
jgi:hypothetical protein